MIQEAINRLDRELKERFDAVYIKEGSVRSDHFFEITLEKLVGRKRVRMVARVSKPDLAMPVVGWRYPSDPRSDAGHVVQRVSEAASLADHMLQVVERGMLDRDYVSSIPEEAPVPEAKAKEPAERSRMVEALEGVGLVHLDSRMVAEDGVMVEVSTFRHTGRATDARRAEMAVAAVGDAQCFWSGDALVVKYML